MENKLYQESYTQNRDLSWLKFNQRVLVEAKQDHVPLLEKLKFLAIFSSNLDEFFMIRVGSLFQLSRLPKQKIDPRSGFSNLDQLSEIYRNVKDLYDEYDETYASLIKDLESLNIKNIKPRNLKKKEKDYITSYFKTNILPLISPQILDVSHPFPFIESKEICLVTRLKRGKKSYLGLVSIPKKLKPLLVLPSNSTRYLLMEDIFMYFLDKIFDSYKIIEKAKICVTRNADISDFEEDLELGLDYRKIMQKLLKKRKRLDVVRLEISKKTSSSLINNLSKFLRITSNQVFITKTPLSIKYVHSLIDHLNKDLIKENSYPKFSPTLTKKLDNSSSLFNQIREKDILLHYPYESFTTFCNLIKEASEDKHVVSINICIYRLSSRSRLIDYLCRASENGIDVTVIIELRARFDEQNNINWSKDLEEAGCRIIYGFEAYKIHSKICLITRKEKEIEYFTTISTGNFNEATAKLYTDLALISNDKELGVDAAHFFNNMLLENLDYSYKNLLVSPTTLKSTIINMIDNEANKGSKGYIFFKINSITDIDIINHLRLASSKGVSITLIVRGISCIIPDVLNKTENIKIYSLVGRFLEHSRIYLFSRGKNESIYISSADFMTRNTENRVEVAVKIKSLALKREIKSNIRMMLKDGVNARLLGNDKNYHHIDSKTSYDSHKALIRKYKTKPR